MSQTLTWTATASTMPDSDLTVLMWVRCADGAEDWASGWWSAQNGAEPANDQGSAAAGVRELEK